MQNKGHLPVEKKHNLRTAVLQNTSFKTTFKELTLNQIWLF